MLIGIYGPTASGKTALAEKVAAAVGAQLINADAFQAYRLLDIGTAKPKNKHLYELVDIIHPNESFGVGEWVIRTAAILERLHAKGQSAVLVGGTGLYLRALFEEYADMSPPPSRRLREEILERERREGLQALVAEILRKDPALAERTDLNNPARVRRALEKLYAGEQRLSVKIPAFKKTKIGIDPDKKLLDDAIEQRVAIMLQNGWVDEVEKLIRMGYGPRDPAFRAIGYRELFQLVDGEISLDEAKARIATATRQYAKRQKTWIRSEPRLNRIAGFGYDIAVFEKAMDCLV